MARRAQQWGASTVVAYRIGADDFYHGGCAPQEAQPYRLGDETNIYDPEITGRYCLECGKPVMAKQTQREAIHEYFWQKYRDDE